MRISAFILATYISFLTVQPMASPVTVCAAKKVEKKIHGCCEKKESNSAQKRNSEENQCPGVCNPFGQGTCCLGSTPSYTYQFHVEIVVNSFNSLTSANLLSNYLADCFHPPEKA